MTNNKWTLKADNNIDLYTKQNYIMEAVGDAKLGCVNYLLEGRNSIKQVTKTHEMQSNLWKVQTKTWLVDSNDSKIRSKKIAIGHGSNELLQIMSDLCKTLYLDTYNLGYPSALFEKYAELQEKIDSIKGSL